MHAGIYKYSVGVAAGWGLSGEAWSACDLFILILEDAHSMEPVRSLSRYLTADDGKGSLIAASAGCC